MNITLLLILSYIIFLIGINLLIHPKVVVDSHELCDENKDNEDSTYKFLWLKEKPMTPRMWMIISWITSWTHWPRSVYAYLVANDYYKQEALKYQR